jgi:hypothetical protein
MIDPHPDLRTCRECGCWVDLKLGEFSPGTTGDREGTLEGPRAPGDWDDICENCDYDTDGGGIT